MAGDNHPDFQGYMESLADRAAKDAEHQSHMQSHQEWLESSWGGYVVRTLQRVGDNKFIHALADAIKDQQGGASVSSILLKTFARISVVIMAIFVFFAIGKLIQMIVGKEIVMEQEVVIIEEVRQSDLKKKDAHADTSTEGDRPSQQKLRRRNAREKGKVAG